VTTLGCAVKLPTSGNPVLPLAIGHNERGSAPGSIKPLSKCNRVSPAILKHTN